MAAATISLSCVLFLSIYPHIAAANTNLQVKTSQQLSFLKDSEREYWNKLIDSNIRSGTVACMWCIKAQLLKKLSVAFHRWKFLAAVLQAADHGPRRRGYISAVTAPPVASSSSTAATAAVAASGEGDEPAADDVSIFSGTGTVSAALKHAISVMNKYNRHAGRASEAPAADGIAALLRDADDDSASAAEPSDLETEVKRKLLRT